MFWPPSRLIRTLRRYPLACFLVLFAAMWALMLVAAVHVVGGDRELLGSWCNLQW